MRENNAKVCLVFTELLKSDLRSVHSKLIKPAIVLYVRLILASGCRTKVYLLTVTFCMFLIKPPTLYPVCLCVAFPDGVAPSDRKKPKAAPSPRHDWLLQSLHCLLCSTAVGMSLSCHINLGRTGLTGVLWADLLLLPPQWRQPKIAQLHDSFFLHSGVVTSNSLLHLGTRALKSCGWAFFLSTDDGAGGVMLLHLLPSPFPL